MAKDFKGFLLLIAILIINTFSVSAAPDGKALFQANCASCHNPLKDATGPALQGISGRAPSKEWIYNWIHNPSAVIASGDKYANDLYLKWNKTQMTAFPSLTNAEIDAVVKYVEEFKAPVVASSPDGGTKKTSDNNTVFYAIITVVLLMAAVILTSVNKVLSRTANSKQGVASPRDVPFFRNKVVIATFSVIAIVAFGVWLTKGSELGRQKNYMPKQPIFYSHKVHAGINQVNCLYCHVGAEKSRHALVPSTNVCMNCHKQINEYTGSDAHPLVDLEGNKVDGTKEIRKLYEYAGWNASKKDYNRDAKGNILAKPIPWVKIHNLPDHVYFNHSLHVVSGKVACQRCHGGIQEMDEVYQFADLSMGWCINCHRATKVQFADNNYYSIFQKYHEEIKSGKREDVKVSDIGGLECQKCHY